jgi:hypothetical protein
MRRRLLILGALIAFISTFSAGSAEAQRRVSVGGHFNRGGGRVVVGGYYGRPGFYRPPVRYYYRPYYRPFYPYYAPGFRLSVLPYGFITLGTAWGPYFYYDGTFYRSSGDKDKEYEVAEPPVGATVPSLPSGAKEVTIDGNTYYEYNGTYYQEVIKQNQRRYAIVGKDGQLNIGGDENGQAPPAGPANDDNIIQELPEGSRKVEINGQTLYVSPDGMYYQEERDGNNVTGYRIVGKETAD